jgi:zinc transport system ATP-binding protein
VLVTTFPGAAATTAEPAILELRGAAFGYADQAVVQGVDLTVHRGEVVAVLGPNGSGKSTLVRGLLGLTDHLGGDVRLFGVPRSQFGEPSRLGYVPQRHTLSASVRATVTEVVATGRLPHHRWWRPVLRSAREAAVIDRALAVVGLGDRAQADVATLSGGQQRRVLIARALVGQPDVLLLDEPTAGVDAANQQVLSTVLERLASGGTTMVIVTHELAALSRVVTRVVVVDHGRVAFDGGLAEYTARAPELGHDHHHHHHDDEQSPARSSLAGTPASGPVDPRGGDRP